LTPSLFAIHIGRLMTHDVMSRVMILTEWKNAYRWMQL